jgi:hypothetical protein
LHATTRPVGNLRYREGLWVRLRVELDGRRLGCRRSAEQSARPDPESVESRDEIRSRVRDVPPALTVLECGVANTVSDTATIVAEPEAEAEATGEPEATTHPSDAFHQVGRRRFTIAVLIGIGVMAIPFLWTLWDLWSGSVNPLRGAGPNTFYDLQARAMFHGRLNLPNGRMGIEAFVHDGRQYTYFGIFPSLLRMPILLLTSRFDGELTAPSMVLAWMATALFSSLMLWRLRIVTRGRAVLGRAEAASFGVLVATIMGGSVIVYLAATPFVFNEDFAWSIPLTMGSLFTLLGVMERPSTGRVWASGILVLLTNLNRTPTGYACVIGALLVALWLGLGRGGASNRRWAVPMLAVALVGFGASCVVTYAKFGTPVGLPMADQVWATVNAHRRYFLAANGGKAFSVGFLPSTLVAYLQPFGIRFSSLFPFVSTPAAPARAIGAVLDQTYPTASVPATMPLLFLLACWGTITSFRPRALVPFRLARIVLVTGAAGTAGVLVWGYISERYMADFMPFLIVASGVGLIDVWRRLERRPRKTKKRVLGLLSAVAVYCVAVNTAIAVLPSEQFTQVQVQHFVSTQQTLGITPLADAVRHGSALPAWAPSGQLFMVGNCSGLYLSSGISETDVPGLLIDHFTWIPVEQDAAFTREIWFTFNRPAKYFNSPVTLMTYGASSLVLEPRGTGYFKIVLENSGTSISWPPPNEMFKQPISVLHQPFRIEVTTDPNMHQLNVTWYGDHLFSHFIAGSGPPVVLTTPAAPSGPLPEVTVAVRPVSSSISLCRSLQRGG